MEAVISSLITGVLALAGVIITNYASGCKMRSGIQTEIKVSQAVTNTKIEELTREVREHNNFAQRVPVLEEQMNRTNKRLGDLEKYHKQPKGE